MQTIDFPIVETPTGERYIIHTWAYSHWSIWDMNDNFIRSCSAGNIHRLKLLRGAVQVGWVAFETPQEEHEEG